MSSSTGLVRKSLALAFIAPMTVFGLVACAGGEPLAERTREPKATAPVEDTSTESGGGSLPFPFPDGSGSDASGSDTGSNGGGSSSDNGSSGGSDSGGGSGSGNSGGSSSSGNVVKYGEYDLSNANWSTICSTDADSMYVIASDDDAPADSTGATLMVSANEDGNPDYLFISQGGESDVSTTLYWSDAAGAGSLSLSFSGNVATASGEAFYFDDYSYTDPVPFEVTLTCDYTY